jgi:hypothetical protein
LGGGINNHGTATLNNTIVAYSLKGGDIYNQGRLFGSNNLVGDGSGLPGWLIGDPRLGQLNYNGGPTRTCALLPGSRAIDAGSNTLALDASGNPLTTDQRGLPRPGPGNSGIDIGAFEVQSLMTATTPRSRRMPRSQSPARRIPSGTHPPATSARTGRPIPARAIESPPRGKTAGASQ